MSDVVYDYTYKHSESKSGKLEERAAGKSVFTEVERNSADTDNEDRRDGVKISVVAEVYVFEHLKSAYGDETVHCDARAAHYAFGNHVDDCHERRYERYEHTHYSRC